MSPTYQPAPATSLNSGSLRVELFFEFFNGAKVAFNSRFEGSGLQFASVAVGRSQILPEQRVVNVTLRRVVSEKDCR